jgi:nucleoside-diphosphate-sugar epimerase
MALRTLITGAAGNLGSLLSRHLAARSCELRLMYHRTPLPPDMLAAPNVQAVSADLADPTTIMPAVEGADVVVHFAGRLFAPRPETFLPETNTRWFANLVTAAIDARVGRVILASFPQVEGPTSVERPRNRPARRSPDFRACPDQARRRATVVRAHRVFSDDACGAAIRLDLRPRHFDG